MKQRINFDYIEAELIAYLSARSIYNLPITFQQQPGSNQHQVENYINFYKKPC